MGRKQQENPAPEAARPLRCPFCGAEDPTQFVVYLGRWCRLPDLTVAEDVEQEDAVDAAMVNCRAPGPDGMTCDYQATLAEFALAATVPFSPGTDDPDAGGPIEGGDGEVIPDGDPDDA